MTFDLGYNGASPPEKIEIEDGTVLSPVEDPARDGYQFDGWYTADGTLYAFKTPVTESFTLTARWTIESSGGGSVPTDRELLEGQWTVYYQSPSDSSGDFQLYEYLLIDIQHTLPEYWIVVYINEDPVIGAPVKSDRTETEGGLFVVSLDSLGLEAEMKYRFVDDERNTLEAEISREGTIAGKCRLERISSEEETKLHIVSFQLDDSISSADGYVLSSELIAVEAGRSLGNSLPTLKQQDGTTVPVLFTTADGTEFTEDTPVNEDITVTVTSLGVGVIGSTHYVSTEDELSVWADSLTNNTSLNCVLLADITLTEDWTPVCIDGYAGTFDGRGHKISDLKIKAQGSNCGLFFGILENAVVKNLTVEVSCAENHNYVGTVARTNKGTIENCHLIIQGNVSAEYDFGGIAATNDGIIKGCSSKISGTFSGCNNAGGIAGTNTGTIAASFMILEATGSLSSTDSVYCAGIAGNNTGSVTGCYSVINGKISNNQSESYAIALGGDCTACYWQSSGESFEDNISGAAKVTTPEEWGEVMSTMNDAIENTGYQFQKNEGTDAETIPLIIVPS